MSIEAVIVVGSATYVATALGFGVALVRLRERAIRAETELLAARGNGTGSMIAEFGEAIRDMALEIERLGEGQRFVARVLTERSSGVPTARNADESG